MKKILKPIAGFLFAAFLIGMFFLVISLTFSSLGRIFPNSFVNQIAGLVLFDIATLVWGLAFVYKSQSTPQYAISAIGFLVGLAGTFVMIASEVTLSAQGLETAPAETMRMISYTFIGVSALHLTLGYAHSATAPDVDAAIRLGAAQAEITDEAIKQAERQLEQNRAALGRMITPRLTGDIRRNLRLPITQEELDALEIIDAESSPIDATPNKAKSVPATMWNFITGKRKEAQKATNHQNTQEEADTTSAPFPIDKDSQSYDPMDTQD